MVSSRRNRSLVGYLVLSVGILLSEQAFAQVNGNTGAFSTSIPIRVPAHHGLEPAIALAYNSLGGNGTVGVGWALTGFPVLERQGADGGTPQFDATDSFRLAGEDLHPCGTSASPGCLAGGTHFTEHENYRRITYDDVMDQWTVDSPNGNRSTYTPVFTVNGSTYRWGRTSVDDTLGGVNQVTYSWSCDTAMNCYPDQVTYNGYRVEMQYEMARSDVLTFGTGASLGETHRLLRTIAVELDDGTPIRAYKLEYSTSPSTLRSLLSSVRTYGKDVTFDANGFVTGGSALPAESFEYLVDASDHAFTGGASWAAGCSHGYGTGDFN